ncbi:MAG: zinc-binding alcohol dehydrogenase family protein [Acidobacteria bacterium]|nr:zinc-binding alcohol dehydrogenase family protein [Acidobacteriota bacterium]
MKALVLTEPGQIGLGQTASPEPSSTDVLLRVKMVGLCGTDLNSYRGKNPLVSYPRIPGHEISAEIVQSGADVPAQFVTGLPVTLSPYTACGKCASCLRLRPNACQFNETLGVQRDGALTEFIAVPWQKLLLAPTLTAQELCLVEPLTVGFHAAARGRVTASDTVAVLGCGAVGLGAVAGAAERGARVIAIDVDDAKLALARQAGATLTMNGLNSEALKDMTGGLGPDVIIEAIGLPQTFRAAVEEVAFTGRVVYIGYAKEPVAYETRLFVQKELDILGSRNALVEDFAAVINMLAKRTFPLSALISRVVSLNDAPQAFADWAANPAATSKILVTVD